MRSFDRVSRWLWLPLVAVLGGCLFSGDDSIAEQKLVDSGWNQTLEVKRIHLEGMGAEALLERVRDTLLFHSTGDYAWDSYVTPYRNSWKPHLSLGRRAGLSRSLYLLFDVTDTVEVAAGELNSLFLSIANPDSLPLVLELPEDTAFARKLDSAATFPKGKKVALSLSWKILSAASAVEADSLRGTDIAFGRTLDSRGFSDPVELDAVRARDAQGFALWSLPFPRELSLDLIEKKVGETPHRFLLIKLDALSDPPLRLASPFTDTTSVGWRPKIKVGDWAERLAARSAEKISGVAPTSLLLRSGVRESLLVHLPMEQLLDSVDANRFASLAEVVVRAKLLLIPASPVTTLFEKEFGAVPLEARATVDTSNAIKKYRYLEPQTGDFIDSTFFPKNWIYAGAPSRSETLTVEIGEVVRRALYAGDDRGVRLTLHLGRRVIDTTINYQGSNQLLPVTLDQIDLGDPSQLRWRIELQTVAPQEAM